jgi:hypothetical protein
LTPEVGRKDDVLIKLRIGSAGREGTRVYGRTLRAGESDSGQAVYLRPGDDFSIRPGDLHLDLDDIDNQLSIPFDDGYASITNTLWTWFHIGGPYPDDAIRFLLAAGRRLDESHRLLGLVRASLNALGSVEHGIPLRNLTFEVIGTVEMAVVAIHRALTMTIQLTENFAISLPVPQFIDARIAAVRAIRDAYEHIDERARGLVRNKKNPDALSGFNFLRLLNEKVVTYGQMELDLDKEATQLLIEARRYLKRATVEITCR